MTDKAEKKSMYAYRIRGPWTHDDWLLLSDEPAAEFEHREKCDVSIVGWAT